MPLLMISGTSVSPPLRPEEPGKKLHSNKLFGSDRSHVGPFCLEPISFHALERDVLPQPPCWKAGLYSKALREWATFKDNPQ